MTLGEACLSIWGWEGRVGVPVAVQNGARNQLQDEDAVATARAKVEGRLCPARQGSVWSGKPARGQWVSFLL